MNKLSFRARPLEASKPMPIFMSEELPDLPEYSAINRAVPQMPSGMKKEEECEHHLQRAMCTGLIIPTPEVVITPDKVVFDRLYPPNFKVTRQLIHMQPFTMEQDIPDYDLDSEDERWLTVQKKTMDIDEFKFEEMMDRLEKNSGHSVVTQSEAKVLLKEDDDLIIAVYDYWLNKRLRTQQSLIPCVRTETHRGGNNNNNPYLAFRRRTEKMQTRKNRKNDESTYEKMVKLKRDLSRAVTLLELVKRRENTKRELLHLTVEVFEKRYQAQDFSGTLLAEVTAMKTSRPAFAPLFTNQYNHTSSWAKPVKTPIKEDYVPRKEKRQYKKRKHKSNLVANDVTCDATSGDDDVVTVPPTSPVQEEAPFTFRRKRQCLYHAPVSTGLGNWPWCSKEEGGSADLRFRFNLTSMATPSARCVGMARRRVGRGGRVILDRIGPPMDDFWSSLDFTIHDSSRVNEKYSVVDDRTLVDDIPIIDDLSLSNVESFQDWPHFRPKTPPLRVDAEEEEPFDILQNSYLSLVVEDLAEPTYDLTSVQLNLSELFPQLSWESVSEESAKRDELDVITPPSESDTESHKRPSVDKREYQSGSLLDRWARFESPPPEPVTVTKPRTLEPITSDKLIGCSAFRTKDWWSEINSNTTVQSTSSAVTPKEVQKESSVVIVEDTPLMPPTPPKEAKTPPPVTVIRANNINSMLNGPLGKNVLAANNRLLSKHLGYNSSYRKRNNHLNNHGMNSKLVMRLPDNTNEIHDSSVVAEKNKNEALLRKSTQVPMEVT